MKDGFDVLRAGRIELLSRYDKRFEKLLMKNFLKTRSSFAISKAPLLSAFLREWTMICGFGMVVY